MIGLAATLALAASQAGYPVAEILTAFGAVCFDPATLQQDNPENPAIWKKRAAEQGWAEIGARPDASDGRSQRAYDWARALDSELLVSFDGPVQLREAALFHRQVAGRAVYLSIAAMDSENPKLAECRLRDPLGDGVRKSPITRAAIEKWLGHSVKTMPAWYRGKQYWWPNGNNRLSVRVHFGFDQRRLGVVGARYDPYALYGLTLVRSDYDEIILV